MTTESEWRARRKREGGSYAARKARAHAKDALDLISSAMEEDVENPDEMGADSHGARPLRTRRKGRSSVHVICDVLVRLLFIRIQRSGSERTQIWGADTTARVYGRRRYQYMRLQL